MLGKLKSQEKWDKKGLNDTLLHITTEDLENLTNQIKMTWLACAPTLWVRVNYLNVKKMSERMHANKRCIAIDIKEV